MVKIEKKKKDNTKKLQKRPKKWQKRPKKWQKGKQKAIKKKMITMHSKRNIGSILFMVEENSAQIERERSTTM